MPNAEAWSVEFYLDDRGVSPVELYLESLQPNDRAVMLRVIKLLGAYGVQLSMPHARRVEGPLWELRAGPGRVFYFVAHGRRCVLLHGYRKKTRRAPRREVGKARRRMARWLAREEE